MKDFFGLSGKNAFLVGGGAGIGQKTAIRLAQAGCNVVIGDVLVDQARGVEEHLAPYGVRTGSISGDVTDPAGAAALVREADDLLGGIDVLVTIVGKPTFAPLIELEVDEWDFDLSLNLRYVFLVGREMAKSMIARSCPGAMTFVTSISGMQSAPKHAAYGAAKAGLIHLVGSMAVEWAQQGIRVNSVGPGSTVTPRNPDTPKRQAYMAKSGVPLGRSGDADEIAKAILFLSSKMGSYITGQNLMVDGGWSAANLIVRPGANAPD